MIRGRQPTILPLAFDPTMIAGAAVHYVERGPDGERRAYEGDDAFARYLADGPACPPIRNDDGSGALLIDLDDGTVEVSVPAGTTWVELTGRWSADDADDLAVEIGPADPLGGVVAEQLGRAGDELRRALYGAIDDELNDWLAAHRIALELPTVQVTADVDQGAEDAVRRESALRDLASRLGRHIDAPGVAGRIAQTRRAVADLGDHPLRSVLEGICDDLQRLRPRAEADYDTDELRAFRRRRKRDRRLKRSMARRCVVRFIGWDEPVDEHWRVFETQVPDRLQDRLIDEICAHVHRSATLLPKRSRGSSRASG